MVCGSASKWVQRDSCLLFQYKRQRAIYDVTAFRCLGVADVCVCQGVVVWSVRCSQRACSSRKETGCLRCLSLLLGNVQSLE